MIIVAGHLKENPSSRGVGLVLRDDEIAKVMRVGSVAVRAEQVMRAVDSLGGEAPALLICIGRPGEDDDAMVADFIVHSPLVVDHVERANEVWP